MFLVASSSQLNGSGSLNEMVSKVFHKRALVEEEGGSRDAEQMWIYHWRPHLAILRHPIANFILISFIFILGQLYSSMHLEYGSPPPHNWSAL